MKTMQAITRQQFGGPEVLQLSEVPMPVVQAGSILIEVRAFGLNRAELYMRRGEWGDVAAISGIECVGQVVTDTTGCMQPGQKVMAFMGGMGRSINGSYAGFTAVPAANVIAIDSELPWEVLAALPESYATAWTCLHRNLELKAGQRLLVRGGTSSLGQAAIALAVHMGAEVIATTRQTAHADWLRDLGVRHILVADANSGIHIESVGGKVDAVLDLLGNSSILDSMQQTRCGGHVCLAGFLGGLAPLAAFNPLAQMPSGVHLSFFGSFNFGNDDFPLNDVPMQQIVSAVETGALKLKPARSFALADIALAHQLMETNAAHGKLVVRV
ncbi:zinc-binding dehydrogenase [Undibacterium sp. TJN19]|uniref:zinc-binding dehydrogenase n=1 Tax=Undibacterium sp. TJN19 TaxID=3413055 RepID=UPI003BF07FFB